MMQKIILRSFDAKDLQRATEILCTWGNIKVSYLPHKTRKITIVRGPHVHKKSREQWQRTQYSREIRSIANDGWLFHKLKHVKLRNVKLQYKFQWKTCYGLNKN